MLRSFPASMKQAGKYIGLQAEIQKKNIPGPCFLSTRRLPARQGKSFGKRFYNGPEHVHNTESLRPEQCAGTDALLPVSGKPCRRSPGSSAQGWTSAAAALQKPYPSRNRRCAGKGNLQPCISPLPAHRRETSARLPPRTGPPPSKQWRRSRGSPKLTPFQPDPALRLPGCIPSCRSTS